MRAYDFTEMGGPGKQAFLDVPAPNQVRVSCEYTSLQQE